MSQQRERRGSTRTPNRYDTVFVGSLSAQTDAAALREAFSRRIGPVNHAAVVANGDGVSKGYGFVSFQNSKLAARAVRHGLGELLHGQHVAVRPSKEGRWRGRADQNPAHEQTVVASSSSVPLPQHVSMPLHADASTGLSVLQAMHAVGVSPNRQTFHNILELCAAVAKSSIQRAGRSPAASIRPDGDRNNAVSIVERASQEALAVSTAVVESHMAAESILPDEETVALQLRVCASCTPPALCAAVALVDPNELQRKGVTLTTKLLNGLLAVYSRAGDVAKAFEIFNTRYAKRCTSGNVDRHLDSFAEDVGGGLHANSAESDVRPLPSRGTYNILISACARAVKTPSSPASCPTSTSAALLQLAFDTYTQMVEEGISPDHITLTSLLHVCAIHAPANAHRLVPGKDEADEERRHTERVIALFEASVSDVTQKREKAALARAGLHAASTPAVEPNVAVFAALISAIAPNNLPRQVAFILGQAEKSNVVLNSFVLLNLAHRLDEVRVDPSQFSLQTRPDVVEAARCALRYAERHGMASQSKGKAVLQQLKRLINSTKHQPVGSPASALQDGTRRTGASQENE